LIVVPLIAALLVFFTKGNASRKVALGLSIVEFILALLVFFQFKHNPESKDLMLNCSWVESLGIHFAVSVDALSMLLILLTTFLVPLIILSSFKTEYDKANSFYGLILLMQ